jgi:hypothetical protein
MKTERPPTPSPFQQVPESPKITPAFRGIVLATPLKVNDTRTMIVHGAVQVPEKDFASGAKVLDGVAIIMTRPPGLESPRGARTYSHGLMPFRDRVVMDDEIVRTGGCVRGYFNVAPLKDLEPLPPGKFYLHAAVGPYVSDILTIEVQ